jgi:hypothetical protein
MGLAPSLSITNGDRDKGAAFVPFIPILILCGGNELWQNFIMVGKQ